MGAVLNIPFQSEAYDRLMEEQATFVAYDRLMKAQSAFVPEQMVEPIDSGEKLRAARAELGITQAALASRLGIDAPSLSKMENGEPIKVSIDLAIRYLLARARLT